MDAVLQALRGSDGRTFAERCAHADVSTYLPDDILVKVDVASMAHGLECRAPFLDHVLAEAMAKLPFELKMRRLRTKRVLKDALARRLPREILERRKQGFGVPLEHWFKGTLTSLLREVLLSKGASERGYFQRAAVERLVDEHARGDADHRNLLFPLLMLELWHRVCL
jgi:asparagine synthase (glutamine-hydrolysing)